MRSIRTSPRARALSAALRQARVSRGVSLRELAFRLSVDQSHISKIETGKRLASVETAARMLGALRTPAPDYERVLELARDARQPNWLAVGGPGVPAQLAGAMQSEREATDILEWSPMIVPGLLQTTDYAKALAEADGKSAEEVESHVAVRGSRRDVLTRRDPVRYEVLIGELALREAIDGPAVMAEQLRQLISIGARPNVKLRIVPLGVGWHPGFAGPFVLYEFAEAPAFVHLEHYSSGAFVAESSDVTAYRAAVRAIADHALSEAESACLIGRLIVEEWSGVDGRHPVAQE